MSADLDPAALQQVIYRLQSENEILKTQMLAAQRMITEGAQPIGTAFVNCMTYWNDLAREGHPQALQNLRNLHDALNESRAIVGGIHLPRNGKERP